MTTPPLGPDVDQLREKLRTLGYLDAGVDRFVLAPARSGRSLGVIALEASLRIGALAGILLGVSGAIGVAVRLPGLITGVGDALVVATTLGTAFGLVSAAVAFLAVIVAGRSVRRRGAVTTAERARRLSRAAGLAAGLASLVYLTLWWRAASPASAWSAPGVTVLALAIAVVISFLLGHTTAATSRALMALDPNAPAPEHGTNLSWRASALLGATAFVAAGLLLWLTTARGAPAPAPASLVVVPTGLRLLVIGVDGFDPSFAASVARARGLETLSHVLEAPHVEIPVEGIADPVPVWMSMATGHPPERHGALGLETRRVTGLGGELPGRASGPAALLAATTDLLRLTRPVLSSGRERREKTFWEVATSAGLLAAAVNWWTTWPASAGDGIVLTDRAALRLARGGPLDREIAPPELHARLEPQWPSLRDDARRLARETAAGLPSSIAAIVEQAAEVDSSQAALAGALDLAALDLATVYLPGLDIAQASVSKTAPSGAASLVAQVEGLERLYAQLDALVAALAARAPSHVVVWVSHPGRATAGQAARLAVVGLPQGPRAAAPASPPRLEDVAPTILYLLGVPVSQSLAGHVRTELAPADFVAKYRPREVATYGPRDTSSVRGPAERALEEEMRDRLRSLGYVR